MTDQEDRQGQQDNIIQCLIPDLPTPRQLMPYLEQIHHNRQYTNFGPLEKQFKQQLIDLFKTTHRQQIPEKLEIYGTLFSSATLALEMAIAELDLKQESLILVPALTFPASASAILRNGLTPLIGDIDPHSWQLTTKMAYYLARYYPIKAVIPVATFGVPVDIEAWDTFSQDTGIKVIIDAAGAFPFQPLSRYCPVVFSFHATKNLGIGEGGAIFCSNQQQAKKYKRLSNFGFHHGQVDCLGSNGKLSEYHAAVGLAQIERWPAMINQRKYVNQVYDKALEIAETTKVQQPISSSHFVPSLKVIKLHQIASEIVDQLRHQDIICRQWYTPPLHQHHLFASFTAKADQKGHPRLVHSEYLAKHLVGLPFHNFLDAEQIQIIVASLQRVLSPLKDNL